MIEELSSERLGMLLTQIFSKILILSAVAIISPSMAATSESATAGFEAVDGSKVSGTLKFTQANNKVHIEGAIKGLKPNHLHGLHVHEIGNCSGKGAKSAGEHFTVEKKPHGGPADKSKHNGDLGNVLANAEGVATVDIYTEDLSLSSDTKDKRSVLNRSIVVHEKEDDLKHQPSGNSGGRIGCGVIKK